MRKQLQRIARRLRALLRRGDVDREYDDEVAYHLAMEAEEIALRFGVSPEEARRRARASFGGVARYRDEHRDARGVRWLEQTARDLQHAVRSLRRSLGFTLSAVGVLALGIGATTAVFSAVNAVLRNPEHDDLAIVFFRGFPSLSTVDYRAIEEQQRSFSAIGAFRGGEAAFRADSDAEPQQLRVGRVTAGYFRALGVAAPAGRLIEAADEEAGAERVAVVSHATAARTLGGAAAAVGRTVFVDGVAHTVVGVLPPTREPLASRADVWTALHLAPPERRGPFGMFVIARLAPGATFESATRDVAGISERIFPLWTPGFSDRTVRFEARSIRSTALATPARTLRLFGAATALVLLIGVANVASLMLVRAVGRTQEVSLRAVLGASRAQLVRLFLAESALLCAVGAAAGVVLGALGVRALIAFGPRLPGLTASSLDARAVAFAAGMALLAGVVVGTYPVAMLLRRRAVGLNTATRAVGGRHAGLVRSIFVTAQFAFALPLLAVFGVLLVSFLQLQRADVGFDTSGMVTVRVSLPAGQYGEEGAVRTYWTRALARVRELPGVREAGVASSLPPDDFGWSNDNFNLVDRPVAPGMPEPSGPWPVANAEYFAALGVPLLEGRLFTDADTSVPVAVVSRAWANRHYPGESPVGRMMVRGGCTECPPTTVIGMVGDVRYSGLDGPLDALYSPVRAAWPRTLYLFVRTRGAADQALEPVQEALRSVDPSVPLTDIATMEQRLHGAMAQPRQWAALLGAFALCALMLAAIGLVGMLSYMVGMRRREIGVRLALGATGTTVVRMVVRNGIAHALTGSVLGFVVAIASARAVGTVLGQERAVDPVVLAAATAALLAVALVACWLPARRAAAIVPLEAMRSE